MRNVQPNLENLKKSGAKLVPPENQGKSLGIMSKLKANLIGFSREGL